MATGPQRRPNDAYEEERKGRRQEMVCGMNWVGLLTEGCPDARSSAAALLSPDESAVARGTFSPASRPRPDGSGSLPPAVPPALEPA